MSKSYTVGYMPKPSYSGTKYEELKDVLKESGIISENTPDNAIPTVVEESLVDLKPENVRGNVKIGNVVGSVIETLEDVNPDNQKDFTIQEFSTNNYFKYQLYKKDNLIYGTDINNTGKIGIYNIETNVYTLTDVGTFDKSASQTENEWYKNPTTGYLYLGGNTNNLYYTSAIGYFYKDEEYGKTPFYVKSTGSVEHLGEKTYFFCSGSSYSYSYPTIVIANKNTFESLTVTQSYYSSIKFLGTIDETIYFSIMNTKDSTLTGLYKLNGNNYELLSNVAFESTPYGYVCENVLFIYDRSAPFVLMVENDNIRTIYNASFSSFSESYFGVTKSTLGTFYLYDIKSPNAQKLYYLTKNSDTLVEHSFSSGGGCFIFNDGINEYTYVTSGDKHIYKLNNDNVFEPIYEFPSTSTKKFMLTKDNTIYICSETQVIRIKNNELFVYEPVSSTIFFICEDMNNKLFVGGYDVYRVNDNSLELFWDNPSSYSFRDYVICPNNDIYLLSVNSDSNYEHNIVALVRNNTVTPMFKFRDSIAVGQYIVQDENALVMKLTSGAIFMIKETNGAFITYRIK